MPSTLNTLFAPLVVTGVLAEVRFTNFKPDLSVTPAVISNLAGMPEIEIPVPPITTVASVFPNTTVFEVDTVAPEPIAVTLDKPVELPPVP